MDAPAPASPPGEEGDASRRERARAVKRNRSRVSEGRRAPPAFARLGAPRPRAPVVRGPDDDEDAVGGAPVFLGSFPPTPGRPGRPARWLSSLASRRRAAGSLWERGDAREGGPRCRRRGARPALGGRRGRGGLWWFWIGARGGASGPGDCGGGGRSRPHAVPGGSCPSAGTDPRPLANQPAPMHRRHLPISICRRRILAHLPISVAAQPRLFRSALPICLYPPAQTHPPHLPVSIGRQRILPSSYNIHLSHACTFPVCSSQSRCEPPPLFSPIPPSPQCSRRNRLQPRHHTDPIRPNISVPSAYTRRHPPHVRAQNTLSFRMEQRRVCRSRRSMPPRSAHRGLRRW